MSQLFARRIGDRARIEDTIDQREDGRHIAQMREHDVDGVGQGLVVRAPEEHPHGIGEQHLAVNAAQLREVRTGRTLREHAVAGPHHARRTRTVDQLGLPAEAAHQHAAYGDGHDLESVEGG